MGGLNRGMPTAIDTARPAAICARIAGTAILAVSVFIFVLGLPPFSYGIWFQREPVSVGLMALGAAGGLCVIVLDLTGHSIGALIWRPYVRLFGAFLIWNAIVSCLHTFPGRSWLGTPETGEGVFGFLALATLSLLAVALWPYRWCRIALAIAAVFAGAILGGIDLLLAADSPWRADRYAGYAGLVGPPIALIVTGLFRRPSGRTVLLGLLVGLLPVAFSGNKTALVLLAAVGPAAFFPARWLVRAAGIARGRRILAWVPVLAMLLTLIAIGGAVAYGDYDPLYSVRSRGLLILAEVLGLRDHPWALLTGFGWGSYNDILYQHNFLPGVHGFVNGVWDPNWEGVGAGAFHVHDDAIEAVLGGGLLSGGLYLALLGSIVAGARRGMLAVGAVGWLLIVASLSFWYPFMLGYPFLALAIAATTAPFGVLRKAAPVPLDGWVRGIGVAAAGLLVVGGVMAYADAKAGGDRLAALSRQDAADIPVYGAIPPDHARGGTHLWWLALNEAAFLAKQRAEGQPTTAAQAQWYAQLLQEVDRWADTGHAGMRLEALILALRNELVVNHERTDLASLRDRARSQWLLTVLRVLRDAPERTDIAVPYLTDLMQRKDYAGMLSACEAIAAIRPNDRICLWYGGFAQLNDPITAAAGLRAMHAALAAHVEAVAPVPDAARDMVEANVPRDVP